MDTVKVTYVGDEEIYSGWDGDQVVNLTHGETGDVSPAKASQLAEDRPYDFEIDGKPAQKRPKQQPAESATPGEEASIDELMKLTRGRLDEDAIKLGIDPSGMPDKRTVANAILARLEDGAAE